MDDGTYVCRSSTTSCFSQNSLYTELAGSADKDGRFQQTLMSVLTGQDSCRQTLHWTCLLEWLMRKVVVLHQKPDQDMQFVPRFVLLNPSVRSKFLSALLENHVRIDEGSLNRFTSCLAPFATVNTWDGYLLQKLQDRLNVAGRHRGSSCDSVYASSVDYSSAGCQMERAGVRGDDQPVAVGVEGSRVPRPSNSITAPSLLSTSTSSPTSADHRVSSRKRPLEEDILEEVEGGGQASSIELDCASPPTKQPKKEDSNVDIAQVPKDVEESCAWLANYWNSSEGTLDKNKMRVCISVLNGCESDIIMSVLMNNQSISDSSETVVSKILHHLLSVEEDLSLKPTIVSALLQRVVLEWILNSKSLSRHLQNSLCQMASRFPEECVNSFVLPWATSSHLCAAHVNVLKRIIKEHLSEESRVFFLNKFLETSSNSTLSWSEGHVVLVRTLIEDVDILGSDHVPHLVRCMKLSSTALNRNMKYSSFLLLLLGRYGQLIRSHCKDVQLCIENNKTFLQKKLLLAFEEAMT